MRCAARVCSVALTFNLVAESLSVAMHLRHKKMPNSIERHAIGTSFTQLFCHYFSHCTPKYGKHSLYCKS